MIIALEWNQLNRHHPSMNRLGVRRQLAKRGYGLYAEYGGNELGLTFKWSHLDRVILEAPRVRYVRDTVAATEAERVNGGQ